MPSLADCYTRLMNEPAHSLHAERLALPEGLKTAAVHAALNPFLRQALAFGPLEPPAAFSRCLALWLRHWRLLPRVAALLGAYRQWSQLARGAALRELDNGQRRFAACPLGPRGPHLYDPCAAVTPQLLASGLATLMAWRDGVPDALGERLIWQFSPSVAALYARLPDEPSRPGLILLAVQYARHAANPG